MEVPAELEREIPVIQAIQAGDRYALQELIARHQRWVRGIVFAQLGDATVTDDVMQTVWMRVWQQAGTLRDVRTWRAWLCRLARNAAYDEARRRVRDHRLVPLPEADPATRSRTADRPDVELSEEEQKRIVQDAIRSLPAIYREPLVLRHMEGWSYREIADALSLPPDTVETRLVRARRLLREMLGNKV